MRASLPTAGNVAAMVAVHALCVGSYRHVPYDRGRRHGTHQRMGFCSRLLQPVFETKSCTTEFAARLGVLVHACTIRSKPPMQQPQRPACLCGLAEPPRIPPSCLPPASACSSPHLHHQVQAAHAATPTNARPASAVSLPRASACSSTPAPSGPSRCSNPNARPASAHAIPPVLAFCAPLNSPLGTVAIAMPWTYFHHWQPLRLVLEQTPPARSSPPPRRRPSS